MDHRDDVVGGLRTDLGDRDAVPHGGRAHPATSRRVSAIRASASVKSVSSTSLTRSLYSRMGMCPPPSSSTRCEPGTLLCSLRAWPIDVSLSLVPHRIQVGTWANASTTWNLSNASNCGMNSTRTFNGVEEIIESTKSTYDDGTGRSPKANSAITSEAIADPRR